MDTATIVKACQAGDRVAFGILYQAYSLPMKEVIAYYIHEPETVNDILHDGFIIAFTSINTLKDSSKVKSWLTSIMKNLSLQYLKVEQAANSLPLDREVVEESVAADDSDDTLTLELLESMISRLPEGYKRVFRLSVLQEMSHKEIASMLGIAPQTSASQLFHAKAMLRRMIRDYRAGLCSLFMLVAVTVAMWMIITKRSNQNVTVTAHAPFSATSLLDAISEAVSVRSADHPSHNATTDAVQSPIDLGKEPRQPVDTLSDSVTEAPVPEELLVNDSLMRPLIQPRPDRLYADNSEFRDRPVSVAPSWSLSISCSGNRDLENRAVYRVPDASSDDGDVEETRRTRYHEPISVGLSVNKRLGHSLSVGIGLRYTYLSADVTTENTHVRKESTQRIHYVGLPLKLNYEFVTTSRMSVYAHGGIAVDLPVSAKESVAEYATGIDEPTVSHPDLKAPIQWSVVGGIGVQYHFTPSVSVYAEPSVEYFFDTSSDVRTVRQERPLEFSIPVGLRLTW